VPVGAKHASILGVGGYRPSRIVTNEEICERIDSSDQWIRERSGIESRRWAAADESVTDMCLAAGGKAVAQAGITPAQVGAVIVATVTHPLQTPSAAAAVAHRLGTPNAAAFDVSAACAGFCYGVSMAHDMVRGGSAEYVLVIGCEKLSDFTDSYDRSTAFIFGDGAGAVVIGPSDEPGIAPTIWGSDGSEYDAAYARYGRLEGQVNSANAKFKMMESGYRVEEIAESAADLARLQANYDLLLAGTRQEEIDEARAKVAELEAKLAELKAAGSGEWEIFKGGVENAWNELATAFTRLAK
jgi:3-oxoacyl-(acyl-carrier-protein) synthase III